MATAAETLNRSLEKFLTRLSRTNERSEKFKRAFKKPRCYKNEFDGCIDTWIEVMKLHFEEEDLTERQECKALTSILEEKALNCVMAGYCQEKFRGTVEPFWIGSVYAPSDDALQERLQDKFLDDLEMLRRHSQWGEPNR